MDIIFKTGEFFYLHRGLLKNKWKEGVFVLYSDSRLQWYEKASDKKPIVNILIIINKIICYDSSFFSILYQSDNEKRFFFENLIRMIKSEFELPLH